MMPARREHKEFHAVDLDGGWHVPEGYPPGIEQKILSGGLDESSGSGRRTRLLRMAPGAFTTKPFVHDYWEEVYVLSGELTVVREQAASVTFGANTNACRPPGIWHGPFRSDKGCLLLETHYYERGPFDPVRAGVRARGEI
jgi:mannose-6-phosphate isomerase-like protein (cupin superfamily)